MAPPLELSYAGVLNCELSRFELLLDISEELFGVGAINDAMIKAEREIRHLTNRDVVLAVSRS